RSWAGAAAVVSEPTARAPPTGTTLSAARTPGGIPTNEKKLPEVSVATTGTTLVFPDTAGRSRRRGGDWTTTGVGVGAGAGAGPGRGAGPGPGAGPSPGRGLGGRSGRTVTIWSRTAGAGPTVKGGGFSTPGPRRMPSS